jgi:hypothetical protein
MNCAVGLHLAYRSEPVAYAPAVQCQLSGESFCTTLRSVGAVAAQRWRTVTGWINVLWFIILLYSYSDAHRGLAAMVKSFGD